MKSLTLLLSAILLTSLLVVSGCRQDQTEATNPSADAGKTLSFSGSFKGPLGVQLWSVRDSMAKDVAGTLAAVRAMGFEEVELAGTYGMKPDSFRTMLDQAGLRATAMHVPFDRLRDSTDVVLAEAKALGAQHVGIAWAKDGDKPFDEAYARKIAADFNRIGQAATAQGLSFFYHVHGYEFQPNASGATPFDVLAEATDSNNVKFEMDVFWVTRPGADPVALLKKYPNRWTLMHIKDMAHGTPVNDHSGGGTPEMEVAVGQGMIDYPAVLKAAQEIGLKGYYLEDETADPFGNLPRSIQFLETVAY